MGDFHTKLKAIYEVAHLTNGDLRPRKPGFMHEELQSLKSSVPKPTFFFPCTPQVVFISTMNQLLPQFPQWESKCQDAVDKVESTVCFQH